MSRSSSLHKSATEQLAALGNNEIELRRKSTAITSKLKRNDTELFLVSEVSIPDDDDDDDDINDDLSVKNTPKNLYKYIATCHFVFLMSLMALYFGYSNDIEVEPRVYNNCVYSVLFLLICNLFLFLDFSDLFFAFQGTFEAHSMFYLISFVVFALISYLLIGFSSNGILPEHDSLSVVILIEFLYYLSLILFFLVFMSYWKQFSFHCSSKSWIHSLLYLSVIGYFLLLISRWLRPLKPKTSKHAWNRYYNLSEILESTTFLLLILFVFCVILGGIGICLFASFASWTSSSLGLEVAFLSFVGMSFVIMLTPLAPGSIVDACGGFIFFLLLFPENYSFFAIWGIAMICIVVMHYIGACIQWWIGSWRSVQVWANHRLPVAMLAASDAVLLDADWFTVGLVGYIFMDTANGLNQGRINMGFWTQLNSEWPAIPNAFGLVSFGITIASTAYGANGYDWTRDAVPLLLIFASVVQSIGFSFGTSFMAKSVDSTKYWTSREKWQCIQFHDCQYGVKCTQNGWNNDVFKLHDLYDLIHVIHSNYLQKRSESKTKNERIAKYQTYLSECDLIRSEHYNKLFADKVIENALQNSDLLQFEKENEIYGYFQVNVDDQDGLDDDGLDHVNVDNLNKRRVHMLLVGILVCTFWASFYGFYWSSDLESTVQNGVSQLRNEKWYSWMSFCVFIAVISFIYHVELLANVKSLCSVTMFVITGCKVDDSMETQFKPINWEKHKKPIEIEIQKFE